MGTLWGWGSAGMGGQNMGGGGMNMVEEIYMKIE
jgi:hypothetical protein